MYLRREEGARISCYTRLVASSLFLLVNGGRPDNMTHVHSPHRHHLNGGRPDNKTHVDSPHRHNLNGGRPDNMTHVHSTHRHHLQSGLVFYRAERYFCRADSRNRTETISAGQKQFLPSNRKYMPLIGKSVLFIVYVVSLFLYLSTCDKHLSCPVHNKQQTSHMKTYAQCTFMSIPSQ